MLFYAGSPTRWILVEIDKAFLYSEWTKAFHAAGMITLRRLIVARREKANAFIVGLLSRHVSGGQIEW